MINTARFVVHRVMNVWLWALPPLGVLLLSLIALLMGQSQLPLITYKSFGAVNGILLPTLCLFTLYSLSRKCLNKAEVIYLSYAVVLACYGTGESINRLWFAHRYIGEYGLVTWLWTWAYPAFYLLMNVPLFHALRWRDEDYREPLLLILGVVAFYGVYWLVMWQMVDVRLVVSTDAVYSWLQLPYYSARVFSVFAYGLLIWRAQRA
jgi:hypothetical protein